MKRSLVSPTCDLLSVLVAQSVGAQGSSSAIDATVKDQAIRELMRMTGAANLGRQVMDQMRPSLEKAIANVPPTFWDDFMAEVKPDELVDRVVPIYAKHFTAEEVQGMIQFYKTPLGQKLIGETPALMRECMTAGQEWGRELGERAYRKAAETPRSTTPAER